MVPNIHVNLHTTSAFGAAHLSQGQKAVDLTSSLALRLNEKLLGEKVTRECERVILKGFNKMKCRLYGNEKLLLQCCRS